MVRRRDEEDDYGVPPEETAPPPPETPPPSPPEPPPETPPTEGAPRGPVIPPPRPPPPRIVPFDPIDTLPPGPRGGPTPPPSLRPHSPPTESSPNASERTQTFHGSEAPIPAAYGETPIGGLLFYAASNASNELILGFVVSEGEIDSFLETKVGDKVMPDMGIVATTYTGTSTQTKDATLSGNDANWTSGLQGIAYAVLKFPPFSTAVESVNPMDVKFKVKGRKIKDSRTGVTAWSDNPALILADVLMSERFGAGIPESKMDFGAAGTWATAANDCDFDVDPGAPVVKRYTFNGVLREQESIEGVIEGIRAHFMGYVIFNNGSYQCFVDKQRAASGITFTDATPATANIIGVPEITVRGFSEVPSKVIVEFANKSKDYQDDSAEAELPGIVFGQSDFKRERRYRLYAVTTYDQAKRIAVHILNRGTQDKAIKFKTFAEGVRPLPMDRIRVTSVVGLTAVDFLVTDSFQDGIAWVIEGESYADATYSDTIQTQVQPLSPQLPDPYAVPPNPTAIVLTEVTQVDAQLYATSKIKIAWTPAVPFYRTTRIEMNDGLNTFQLGDWAIGPIEFPEPRLNALHTVTLTTVTITNKKSTGAVATITPVGPTPTIAPTSLTLDSAAPAAVPPTEDYLKVYRGDHTELGHHYDVRFSASFIGTAESSVRRYVMRVYRGLTPLPSAATWADGAVNEVFLPTDAVVNGKIRGDWKSAIYKWFNVVEKFSADPTRALLQQSYDVRNYRIMVRAEGFNGLQGPITAIFDDFEGSTASGTAPDANLHIVSESGALQRGINNQQSTTDGEGAIFSSRKSRGTFASKTAIATGDIVGDLWFQGWDGAAWANGARIRCVSEGTIAAGKVPTRMQFEAMNDAGLYALWMTLQSNGRLSVGFGNSAPSTITVKGPDQRHLGIVAADLSQSAWQSVDATSFYLDVNRRTVDGVFSSTSRTHSRIRISSNNGVGFITFATSNTNNIQAPVVLTLDGSGSITATSQPRARAFHGFAQAIPNATFTALLFDSESYDVQAIHNTVTNNSRFTVPAGGDGLYLIVGGVNFDANATGQRQLTISLNGTVANLTQAVSENAPSGTQLTRLQTVDVRSLVAGDYVEFHVYQDSGADLNTVLGNKFTFGLVAKLW